MKSSSNLDNVMNLVGSHKGVPALTLIGKSPETAAVISKLVHGRELRQFDVEKASSFYNMDQTRLSAISDTVKDRISDAENMMQLFPDLELAEQILVSSIQSPKDMVNTQIIYRVKENLVPADVAMKICDIVEKHANEHYKLKQQLPTILRDVLFNTGSYVKAIIPESSIDELINGKTKISTEQLSDLIDPEKKIVNLGFLGKGLADKRLPTATAAFESFRNYERIPYQHFDARIQATNVDGTAIAVEGFNVELTDNYNFLKLPMAIAANNAAKVRQLIDDSRGRSTTRREVLHVGIEAQGNPPVSRQEMETLLYKGSQNGAVPFMTVKSQRTSKRRSIGRPLDMKFPSESIIPVHVPGDPKTHIGYFVLIDEEGHPVTRNASAQAMGSLQSNMSGSSSMTSFLLAKARKNLTSNDANKALTIDQAAQIYSEIVESDLIERLRNGVYGSNAEISKNSDVYRIMMARSFANQYTRLLYIPAELVTYFAYKYHDNGIGKSLLDDLKVVTSLRSILLFAKVMAMTKNSIALTHVNMTLDPQDPDPTKTIEMSIHEIIKMRQQYFPLGINSPVDLVDWIQRAGFEFTFEGHPGLPQTKFDFETKQMQHTLPDSDLEDLLRKQTFQALGLSPETVDNGFSSEFATTVVSNNILLSKRVLHIQEQFTPQLSDYVRKFSLSDSNIRNEVIEVLKGSKGLLEKYLDDEDKAFLANNEEAFFDEFTETVINNVEVDLPKPDITTLETQAAAFTQYSESLDKALDAWIHTDFMNEVTAGEMSGNIDTIKSVLKAHYLRRWMAENGFMSELADIVSTTEEGKPTIDLFDMMKEHNDGILRSSAKFIESVKAMKEAAAADLAKAGVTGAETSSSTDAEGGGTDGGDDFDLGIDMPQDSTPPADEAGPGPEATEDKAPTDETEPAAEATPKEA